MSFDQLEVTDKDGVSWHQAKTPPLLHKCWAQTEGWIGFNQVQRCPCGAMRTNRSVHPRWHDKNSTKLDAASSKFGLRWMTSDAVKVILWGVISCLVITGLVWVARATNSEMFLSVMAVYGTVGFLAAFMFSRSRR